MDSTQATPKAPAAKAPQYHIDDEIACLMRELKIRQVNYPKWVSQGRMAQETADYEIAVMTSAIGRLKSLRYLLSQIAPVF